MSRYTRIAIDIDDTVADSTEALRRQVNSVLRANLTAEDYKQPGDYWGYYRSVWERHGIAEHLDFDALNQQMVIDQSHVPLIEGAQEAVRQLARYAEVYIITSRDPSWEAATRQWFRDYFGHDDIQLHFCANHRDETAQTKGELCKELGVQLLIDDNASHCKTAIDKGVDAILFGDYGWHYDVSFPITRIRTWDEIVGHLYG